MRRSAGLSTSSRKTRPHPASVFSRGDHSLIDRRGGRRPDRHRRRAPPGPPHRFPTIIPSQVVIVAFLFSLVVGIFFGLHPANKTSRLNPIEALHYE
ncbi:MAG: ABC transporter permease [Nitrospira defluvii]|nr:ABC transporter permease [Nitrospira defluvii]